MKNLLVAAAGFGSDGGSRFGNIRVANEALLALSSLAGFEGHLGEPVNQVQKEVRARCMALASRWRGRSLLNGASPLGVAPRDVGLWRRRSQQHIGALRC